MKKEAINHKIVLLFVAFMIFLYVQHQFVYLYFDDYGYASLSYGYTENTKGMNYSVLDAVKFMWWHYFNWGGRVLYYLVGMLSMKAGLGCVRLLQSIFLLGISVYSYLLIKSKGNEKGNFVKATAIVLLYGFMGLATFQEGIFWYSAAMGYVWALLPLFAAMYYQKLFYEEGNKKYLFVSGILFFLAGFSYEQIALLTIVYVVLYYLIEWFRNRLYIKGSIYLITLALLGSGLEILAPGNFARADEDMNSGFYALSLMGKVRHNIPQILNINLGIENKISVLAFLISGIMVSYLLQYKYKKTKSIYKGNVVAGLLLSVMVIVSWWQEKGAWLVSVLLFLWIVWYCVNITIFLYNRQRFLIALFYGGICSIGMMLIAPSVPMRCHISFEFVMHIIVAYVTAEFLMEKGRVITSVVLSVMAVLALYNVIPITVGYYNNAVIHDINHNKLVEKSARIKAGMEVKSIILYRLKDDRYASQMPYQTPFIEYWMKNYYEIPNDVQFIWDELNAGSTNKEEIVSDTPQIAFIFPEKIDGSADYNKDGSLDIGVTPEIISDKLKIRINGIEFVTVIDNGFASTTVPAEMLQDNLEISLYDVASGNSSNIVTMEVIK